MSETVIKVENLSKQYRIGAREGYKTFRETLVEAAKAPFRAFKKLNPQSAIRNPQSETIWALKDVSFEVKQGEVVGIIGRNGAGKSTLLKILSQITEPTEGRVELKGRIGSLLEVGTGFHPELTGHENIYLYGAILGMDRWEVTRKFDEIVAFAELEKFIDTPVKRYSSGMYMRLAFAVAAHLEPEILLVDEVLAVGDAAFQKKCLGKMGDVAREGRTVLFVSHNMAAVQSLCRQVIWLNDGRIVEQGESGQIISNYLQTSLSSLTKQIWEDMSTAPGNQKVRIHRAEIRPDKGPKSDPITIRTPFVIEFEYWNLQPNSYLNLSMVVYDDKGVPIFNTVPINEPKWHGRPFPVGLFRSECYIPGDLLNDGMYRVELLVVKDQGIIIYRHDDILAVEVEDAIEMRGGWHGKWIGAIRPNFEWSTEFITPIQTKHLIPNK